ncbi:SDR family oxidoreductase [Herbiconiux sp. VKM Ac-1786]|uniref:SDR family oxidoreductase n=1 Tax=Herbiconiux sp. VKM Ac-1786 TaxID=2783824 RepID=UPI00188BD939|nr:SDR family oxidoreductase [Herbiconiux sp. VKM Ac-1786]MBF4572615.1 SDR family oxidoreductase [Herbiconiux sp. VKM Ac-1786]
MSTAGTGRRALVIGSTGIAGQALCRLLLEQGFETFGVSRSATAPVPGVQPIAADLLDAAGLTAALSEVRPELVFITAWMRQPSEAQNIEVNSAIVRNVIDATAAGGTVQHVALLTGLKHYLGPFDDYATGVMADTPFEEESERLDSPNFYYAQEDELFAGAARHGYGWSVHRAHTVFGYAVGNAMNMALTLSVYATICARTGEPFRFPGSATQWNGVTDVTDSDLLAEQLVWAATDPAGRDQAFNIANGDVFRWRTLWPRIAEHFGVAWEGFDTEPAPLEGRMGHADEVWREIAAEHGLAEADVSRLASWWHTDGDLGRNLECFTSMNKSREAGFLGFRTTPASFFDKVERYRASRILP